ncbi:hypothetical protein CLOP_g15783 [Closterium sp. NIES-67]|nr:hypothetical protein CLOP_g15783 [Closterium sp. NIES-67]
MLDKRGEEFLNEDEAEEIRGLVKKRWDQDLACPLHVVGRMLNPANQTEGIFRKDKECTTVLKKFLSTHFDRRMVTLPNGRTVKESVVLQDGLTDFFTMRGSFGLAEAIADRELVKAGEMDMVRWWTWHGTDHPALTALACRVLTQAVSAAACERNWAVWDSVHTAKRNRLGSEKCRDLVYVAHNWHVVHNCVMLM